MARNRHYCIPCAIRLELRDLDLSNFRDRIAHTYQRHPHAGRERTEEMGERSRISRIPQKNTHTNTMDPFVAQNLSLHFFLLKYFGTTILSQQPIA